MILFMSQTHAEVIKVKRMVGERDLERSYVLKTNLNQKIVLDCQSFIQGLRFGEFEEARTVIMDSDECEALQKRIRASLIRLQKHCVDVDQDIRADYTCN